MNIEEKDQEVQTAFNHADIENAINLLDYYHRAMESRRGIELKIFTGIIAFFLVVTKGLYDRIETLAALTKYLPTYLPGTTYIIGIPFILCIFIYLFMLCRIETASKMDRSRYHFWENRIDTLVKERFGLSTEKSESEIEKEGFLSSWFRSWAAAPPFMAALLIALSCWLILVIALNETIKASM